MTLEQFKQLKIGDRVRINNNNIYTIYTIRAIDEFNKQFMIKNSPLWWGFSQWIPYKTMDKPDYLKCI